MAGWETGLERIRARRDKAIGVLRRLGALPISEGLDARVH